MMRLFLIFCGFIVAGGLLSYFIQQGSGYILIVWGQTSIEVTLWFGLLVLLTLILCLWLIWFFVGRSVRGVIKAKQKLSSYSAEKAQQQTVSGLIDYIEENWAPAHKKLTRSAKKVPSPIINYLAAARSAYEMGDEQRALQLLHSAEKSDENSKLAVCLTQVRMQLVNKQFEQALATLARASAINAEHNVVLSLQKDVYIELKDWQALKELLPKLHKHHIGSVKERYYLEQTIYRELFAEVVKSQNEETENKYENLAQAWKALPEHFQKDEQVLTDYAKELIRLQKYDQALSALSKGLTQHWYEPWVEMFGSVQGSKPEAALKEAELWIKQHPESSVIFLTLGRLCLQNKQWGRAKDFFISSIQQETNSEAYAELARLQNFLGHEKDSQNSCRKGLLASTRLLVKVPDFDKS